MSAAQSEEETPTEGASAQPKQPVSAASRHAARRAAKAAAKAAKKGTAPAMPDELQQKVVEAATAYERNARKLWAIIAGILLLAGGAIAIQRVVAVQDYDAGNALAQGVEAARAPIVKPGDEPAEDEDDTETYPSAEARANKALEAYRKTAKDHAGSLAARWARLGEGSALAELGKHAEAEKVFSTLTKDETGFIAARATEGVAFALEGQGKHAEAAAQYELLGKLENGAFKPLADYHRARALIAQGKPRDAAGVLEALVKAERGKPESAGTRFPSVVSDAETLLTELSVSLGDPKLKAEIPKARGAGGGSDVMDALRLQLGGEGGSQTLTPEMLEMLQKQLGGHGDAPAPAAP